MWMPQAFDPCIINVKNVFEMHVLILIMERMFCNQRKNSSLMKAEYTKNNNVDEEHCVT